MKIVEQVDSAGNIVFDYDVSLPVARIYERLSDCFPNIHKEDGMIVGRYKEKSFAIRCKNITYLGHPHPLFKKRIQIADDLQEFYRKAIEKGYTPILMGIYTYGNSTIFCDFNIEDYIYNKTNNSSAHVYTDDLAACMDGGYFHKEDYFGNRITAFRPDYVQTFLDEKLNASSTSEQIDYSLSDLDEETDADQNLFAPFSPLFVRFFENEPRLWNGIECYQEMINAGYHDQNQAEWAAAYLEYRFDVFIRKNNLKSKVHYEQDKTKNGIDLDLVFPPIGMYGDLKAHSNHSRGIQGNDLDTVKDIINTPGKHIYYIVGSHDTYKDSDYDYEVTQFWNGFLGKDNPFSYANRMKHHVEFTHFCILDICKGTEQFLKVFRQGINSNGNPREPKILIDCADMSKFSIFDRDL